MKVSIPTARQKFEFDLGGEIISATADFSDENVSYIIKAQRKINGLMDAIERQYKADGRDDMNVQEIKAVTKEVVEYLQKILGKDAYKEILHAIGGGDSVPSYTVLGYLSNVYAAVNVQADLRIIATRAAAVAHYMSESDEEPEPNE